MPTTLFALLAREAAGSRRDIFLAVLVSAAANTAILVIINNAAAALGKGAPDLRDVGLFLVALALYVLGLRYTFDSATRIFEQMLATIRIRLMAQIGHAELMALQKVGRARIFQAITQDLVIISESQGLLVAAAHSAVMVSCTGLYVLTLSMPAFLIIVGVIGAGVMLYLSRMAELNRLITASTTEEIGFIGMMSDLIDGVKEVKLSHARREALLAEIRSIAARLRNIKMQTTSVYNSTALFSQSFFYMLLGLIVFALPSLVSGFAQHAPEMVATVLFIFGPLSTVITAVPAISKADRAAGSLIALEGEVSRMVTVPESIQPPAPLSFRRTLTCKAIEFSYPGEAGETFHIGPIDLTIRQGEITMFVGGNGSGKTTLLKVMAGLYPALAGALLIDGKPVAPGRRPNLRELFGGIFSDFHLFSKLYGITPDTDAIAAHLDRMRIADKVGYDDGFTTRDLSTGQRKRVAMLVTLLEDRPVLVFDEWAAEQDPEFRHYFYEELLPELKAAGKTLLIATHDDRYFGVADLVVKMEMGVVASTRRRKAMA